MNMKNYNESMCIQAELYYYDFISDTDRSLIPEQIIEHIEECPNCQKQLKKLEESLAEDLSGPDRRTGEIMNECLKLHFAYVDRPVTCLDVRPFLPALLDEDAKVRIPTPITVHLDNCVQCRNNMEVVRELGLSKDHLWLLSQFFADSLAEENTINCPTQLTERPHVYRAVHEIMGAPQSGVTTTYRIEESAKADPENPYAGSPVRVEIEQSGESNSSHTYTTVKFRPLLRPAVAAAAIVLVAIGIFISTTVRVTAIERVYKAIADIKNAHIAQFEPQSDTPMRQRWISKPFNIYMVKSGNEITLWNIADFSKKTKLIDTGTIEVNRQAPEKFTIVKERLRSRLGIVPFERVSDIPVDARWENVTDTAVTGNIKVYDLTWSKEDYIGSVILYKWRAYMYTEGYLPYRVEWYQKLTENDDYTLTNSTVIRSLNSDEFLNAVKAEGF